MTFQEALDESLHSPELRVVVGSRLFGTNHEGSDYDRVSFIMPPYEAMIGIEGFKYSDLGLGPDNRIYSAYRFVELVASGCPHTTETMFAPEANIEVKTELADEILSMRDILVSKNLYRRVMGFGYSEWRKAQGVKAVNERRTQTEDEVINGIRNVFKLDKRDMDDVISTLMKNKPIKLVPSKGDVGAKRRKEYEEYGFGVTSAAHALRLTQQIVELLETGTMTFPRPNSDFLRDIRRGKHKLAELEELYNDTAARAEGLYKTSELRDRPDKQKMKKRYALIVRDHLMGDRRFVNA